MKRCNRVLFIVLAFLFTLVFFSKNVFSFTLVEEGNPKAIIVLGETPTSIEKNSAEELTKYIKEMSGADLKVAQSSESKVRNVILIGRSQTNPLIEELSRKGLIKLSEEYPGLDGFIIKTLTDGGKNYLVLGGSIDRGTVYAVYHLLEKELNVGFFEDGDRVPSKKSIAVDCDIAERPYFEARGSLITGPMSRNAMFWSEKEWKQEIDWLLKKKYNMMQYAGYKWMLDYGRARGMRFIYSAFNGRVSADFMRAHPKVRYLTIHWPWTATTQSFIDPRDPYFLTYATERYEQMVQDWGTDHLFSVEPWGETPMPGKDEEERREVMTAYARSTTQALVNADPEAVNVMHGWAFGYAEFWSSEDVKAYLDAVVSDLIVMDMKADRGDPIYKQHNNFWGKKWLFCIMDGGEYQGIKGDIRSLIKSVQKVAAEPETKNCVGLYSSSESIRYNFLYYDLFSELGWDPRKIKLESFLKEYASRRYGRKSAGTMLRCLEKLSKSVYRNRNLSGFRHTQRLPHPYIPISDRVSSSLLSPLEEAIRIALREKGRQHNNPLYARDVIDMTRLYLDNVLNVHIANLERHFRSGNEKKFEQEVKAIYFYLGNLQKLTSSWPDYRLQTRIDAAANQPQHGGMATDRWIRMGRVTSTSGGLKGYPAAADYNHCDYFELIKFYYRRRIGAYVKTLREKMAKGINKVSLEEMEPTYRKILADWVDVPFKVEEKDRFAGTPVEAVVEVFKRIEKGKDAFQLFSEEAYQENKPVLVVDDKQESFWQAGGNVEGGAISFPTISDDRKVKAARASSLRLVVGPGSYRRWSIIHVYRPAVDWSGNDLFTFYWHGANTGGQFSLSVASSGSWKDYFTISFIDDFTGWKRLVFPFDSFQVVNGDPSWGHVEQLLIRTISDNLSGTWYLDRVLVDKKTDKK